MLLAYLLCCSNVSYLYVFSVTFHFVCLIVWNAPPIRDFPTPSGITEENATKLCTDAMHRSNTIGQCVSQASLNFFNEIGSCIEDIKVSTVTAHMSKKNQNRIRGFLLENKTALIHKAFTINNKQKHTYWILQCILIAKTKHYTIKNKQQRYNNFTKY